MTFLRIAAPLAVSGLIAVVALPAWAQDNQAVLDRFKAVMAEQGTTVAWQSTDNFDNADGQAVISLNDVTLTMSEQTVDLPVIELVEVGESDDGFTIAAVQVPGYNYSDGEMRANVTDVALEGVVLSREGTENAFGTTLYYDAARIGEIRVSIKDAEVFTLTDAHVTMTAPAAGSVMGFEGAAEAFTVALGQIEDPATKAAVTAMGYENMEGYFELDGSWDPTSGQLALTQYDITVVDAGTLGLSFDLGGYTPDFIKSLRQMQEQMASSTSGDNSAQGLAILGLMQQLTFNAAQIAFTDDSLTGKVLEYVGSQQGQSAQAIANQAKAVVPFMLMQLNDPELTQAVAAAVTAFLDDPQSLTISARPAAPVPFALIMAGAMSAPQGLPKQLGVTVTAND